MLMVLDWLLPGHGVAAWLALTVGLGAAPHRTNGGQAEQAGAELGPYSWSAIMGIIIIMQFWLSGDNGIVRPWCRGISAPYAAPGNTVGGHNWGII